MSKQINFLSSFISSKVCMAIALSTLAISSAHAQNEGLAEPAKSSWALGGGVVAIDKAYRDFDTEILGMPVVSYENKWISASIPTFDVKLYSGDALSFRLRVRYARDGYEDDDSPFLAGMEERKASAWAGGAVIWKNNFANVSAEFLTDVMEESEGTRARLQIDRRFAMGKFGISPRVAAEWVDDKYVDYYYGVRQSEVTANRAFYEGKATTNVHVGVRMDYTMARKHTVFLDLSANRFGSAVDDSPLVDKPDQTSIGLGYVYRF